MGKLEEDGRNKASWAALESEVSGARPAGALHYNLACDWELLGDWHVFCPTLGLGKQQMRRGATAFSGVFSSAAFSCILVHSRPSRDCTTRPRHAGSTTDGDDDEAIEQPSPDAPIVPSTSVEQGLPTYPLVLTTCQSPQGRQRPPYSVPSQ